MEYTLKRLLGGVANGKDVPGDWTMISEWTEPGTGIKSIYEMRHYYEGKDRYNVWVAADVPEPDFIAIMRWHREMYRGDLVDAQKDLLRESIAAATSYTNAIMVAGIAALFTLWSQLNDQLTPVTSFSAAVFLSLSVLAFVGWEIFGMIVRGRINLAIGRAVNDPSKFESRIRAHRENMAEFTRVFQPVWYVVISIAAGCGLAAFLIMLSAVMHGAWLQLA